MSTIIEQAEARMEKNYPIYTKKTECQDCYKCVRECPVKAIKVEDGYASIINELCVLCGHCVDVCPSGAKQVRDDVPAARRLLAEKSRVIVSLAPSFISEFAELRPGQLIAAIRKLGFYGVSETALGAEQVSAHVGGLLERSTGNVFISSACPTAVEYLRKYESRYAPYITQLLSPLLSHARLLRSHFGQDIGIVFIGPCIAKKLESDRHPELVEVALTFEDLRRWFDEAQIDVEAIRERGEDFFIPRRSREGALYPIEGGMIASIQGQKQGQLQTHFVQFSGIRRFSKVLSGVEEIRPKENLFLELLACYGGCVNGPKSENRVATVCKHYRVTHYAEPAAEVSDSELAIDEQYVPEPVVHEDITDDRIREALRKVGKVSETDELNCGGCGYDSCRDFARAMIENKAELSMCVSYMRTLAQKKAHILIQKMPSAVVIVDQNMRIVECNPNFVSLFGDGTAVDDADNVRQLEGEHLETVMPFHRLFQSILRSGEDLIEKDVRYKGRFLHAMIFTIEKQTLVGALFEDITNPAMQREQIIKRARHVIQQNLTTVQKIAYLIGENAAESEIILNSIVESFSPVDEESTND
jgi:iron only hydrogenase large subunit-like protein